MNTYAELQQKKEELTRQLKEVTKTLEGLPKKEYSLKSLDEEFSEYLYHVGMQPKYLLVSDRFDSWLKGVYLTHPVLSKRYGYKGLPIIVTNDIVDFEWVG